MWLFGDRPLRDDVLSGAIVDEDICALTGNTLLCNGLTSDDHWHYSMYAGDGPIRLDWRRPIEDLQGGGGENRHYKRMEEITLTLDGDTAGAMKLAVPKERQRLVVRVPAKAGAQHLAPGDKVRAVAARRRGANGLGHGGDLPHAARVVP